MQTLLNNFLITGLPRSGKTTLIKKLMHTPLFSQELGGFITEEIREKGERVGFKIVSLSDKKEGLLARKGFPSSFRLGRYGINLEDLDKIGITAIQQALLSGKIIIVDEIGKMEIFSKKFKNILLEALDSPQKVLATIMERSNDFADRIKKRNDVKLVYLNRTNFEKIFTEAINWIKDIP